MNSIEERLATLEKKGVRLRWVMTVQTCFLLFLIVLFTYHRFASKALPRVVRVRGLIVEDDRGRPRILLGSPFPKVAARTRQDSENTAMVFLDEQGHDRLTLGEEGTPQIAGKVPHGIRRIAPGFGVVIHDEEGNERGAYGWLANGRALITLDRPGLDAWAAIVDDKTGFAGMRIEYAPNVASDKTAIEIGTQGSEALFRLMDTKERNRAVMSLQPRGEANFTTFDNRGNVTRRRLL